MKKKELDKNDLKGKMTILFQELYYLNCTAIILEKIIDFPFNLLRLSLEYRIFFQTIFRNFFEYSFISINRIFYDTSHDCITLRKVKNEIYEYSNDELKERLNNKFKIFQKGKLKKFEKKITNFRNYDLAHKTISILGNDKVKFRILFPEFKRLIEELNLIFDIISEEGLEATYVKYPPEYYQEIRGHRKTYDIDKILDKIAMDSEILTLPEKVPMQWLKNTDKWEKEGTYSKNIKIINDYRTRLLSLNEVE